MTYDEALKALRKAQFATWFWDSPVNTSVHDGLTQAIEVLIRMKQDLDYWQKRAQNMYDKSLEE